MTIKSVARSILGAAGRSLRSVGVSVPETVFKHLHFKGPFTVKMPNGETLTLMSWGHRVENELYWRGWTGHEPETMPWWLTFAEQGGDVLDIGANTATFAFMAKKMNPTGKVVAFEPIARIAALARQNVDASGLDVDVLEMAVADVEGRLQIHDPGGNNAYSASLSGAFLEGSKDAYEVEVTTIDAICAKRGLSPKLIKIDVEGVEGRALVGARETIAKNGCRIVCEWLGNDDSHGEAIKMFNELDYVALDTDLGIVDLSQDRSKEARNLLFVPKGDVGSLRKAWT